MQKGSHSFLRMEVLGPARIHRIIISNGMDEPDVASISTAVSTLEPFGGTSSLSDDVLSHIFHYLDAANLSNSALVCVHWHQVLWPSLRHLQFVDSNTVNKRILDEFVTRCQSLTALTLFRCLSVRDDCALAMLQMRHLRSVSVTYCDWITDNFVDTLKDHPSLTELALVASCRVTLVPTEPPPRLTVLTLSACRGLEPEALPILSRLSRLHTLDLSDATPSLLANDQVNFLVGLQSLKSIDLRCSGVIDPVLHVLGELPRLEYINLASNAKVTALGVQQLSKLGSLRSLNLASCTQVAELALYTIAKLVTLENLDISFTSIIEDSLETLSSLTRLKTLRATKVNPGPAFLASLARHNTITSLSLLDSTFDPTDVYLFKGLTALRTLNLRGSRGLSDSFFSHLAHLTQLHTLDMSSNYDITSKGVSSLKSLPILSTLYLDWGVSISDSIGLALASFPSLTSLSLKSCHGLTDACLPSLLALPKIAVLDVKYSNGIKGSRAFAKAAAENEHKINLIVS